MAGEKINEQEKLAVTVKECEEPQLKGDAISLHCDSNLPKELLLALSSSIQSLEQKVSLQQEQLNIMQEKLDQIISLIQFFKTDLSEYERASTTWQYDNPDFFFSRSSENFSGSAADSLQPSREEEPSEGTSDGEYGPCFGGSNYE